jgi:hypothetical protein
LCVALLCVVCTHSNSCLCGTGSKASSATMRTAVSVTATALFLCAVASLALAGSAEHLESQRVRPAAVTVKDVLGDLFSILQEQGVVRIIGNAVPCHASRVATGRLKYSPLAHTTHTHKSHSLPRRVCV